MSENPMWQNPVHQEFVGALDVDQLTALWELIVVGALADDDFSQEEHDALAAALDAAVADSPIERSDAAIAADIDRLREQSREDARHTVTTIAASLGTDAARRGAFRTVVQVLQSELLGWEDVEFVRMMGAVLGVEDEIIEFALSPPP